MGNVMVTEASIPMLNARLKKWVLEKGYQVGFLDVFEEPYERESDVPYFSVFETTPTHRGHGFFLARLRQRRRRIGTLLFGKDWRTERATDDKNWVLRCRGTDSHLQVARAFAVELATQFNVNISVEHGGTIPEYENFPSELTSLG